MRGIQTIIPLFLAFLGLSSCAPAFSADTEGAGFNRSDTTEEKRNPVFLEQTPLFVSGTEGYHTFRIPAMIVTQRGTILAFCEGRKKAQNDFGDIDTVLKRSFGDGKTWSPLQVVADDGPNTMGNPCPVQDRTTGTIWLLLTRNLGEDTESKILNATSRESRTVWVCRSDDDGATWSDLREITDTTKLPDWTWYATGPGNGIQLRSGRLVIPCDHAMAGSKAYRSHVIYSEDHGTTWHLGGSLEDRTNECQVVECEDGSLLLNMRSYHGKNRRAVARSRDGGLTWSKVTLDPVLIEPVCQASFIRYTWKENFGRSRVLFSNPADTNRTRLTVRMSYDDGNTWPVSKLLNPGPSAYSSLAVLADHTIGCLYEKGEDSPYETITFARFSLEWLTDGGDRIPDRD